MTHVSLIVGIDGSGYMSMPLQTGYIFDWLPDSEHIIITGERGGGWGVIDINGTTPVLLPGQGVIEAVVTTNGKRVLFSISARNNRMGAVDIDGSNLTFFPVPDPPPGYEVQNLVLSPDGQLCAYTWLREYADYETGPIWVMDINGSNQRELGSSDTLNFDLAWAPDGHTIAFARRDNSEEVYDAYDRSSLAGSLWLIDVESGKEKQILSPKGQYSIWSPQWTPDGYGLVFLSNQGGESNLWFIHPDGSGLQQLTQQGDIEGNIVLLAQ